MSIISKTATVHGWGSDRNARRVANLTANERAAIRRGETVLILGAPIHSDTTTRQVVERNGRFYARMPTMTQILDVEIAQGTAWVRGQTCTGDRWPDGGHLWIVDDWQGATHHIPVTDRPEWVAP